MDGSKHRENKDNVQVTDIQPAASVWKREAKEWIVSIVVALLAVLLLNQFVFVVVNVDGNSMLPTIHNNDKIIVTKLGYKPKQGDIIVFVPQNDQSRHYIKRVIAVEGQSVQIDYDTNTVYVDGKAIEEPYLLDDGEDTMLDIHGFRSEFGTVPQGHCFVLGDNRNDSKDSRVEEVGFVSYDSITGKAALRFYPFQNFGTLNHSL